MEAFPHLFGLPLHIHEALRSWRRWWWRRWPLRQSCYNWGRTIWYYIDGIGDLVDLPRLMFIDEEFRNLKAVVDGGELTRNINRKKKSGVLIHFTDCPTWSDAIQNIQHEDQYCIFCNNILRFLYILVSYTVDVSPWQSSDWYYVLNGFGFISNDNISRTHLWKDGIHLEDLGTKILAGNFVDYLSRFILSKPSEYLWLYTDKHFKGPMVILLS